MLERAESRSGLVQTMTDPDPGGPKTYGSGSTALVCNLLLLQMDGFYWLVNGKSKNSKVFCMKFLNSKQFHAPLGHWR